MLNLGNLSDSGHSNSSTGWITNPLRRLIWWLIRPYFQGAAFAIHNHTYTAFDQKLEIHNLKLLSEKESRMHALEGRLLGSFDGLRKDVLATSYRLSGLEEEGAEMEQAWLRLTSQIDSLNELIRSQDVELTTAHNKLRQLGDQADSSGISTERRLQESFVQSETRLQTLEVNFRGMLASTRAEQEYDLAILRDRLQHLSARMDAPDREGRRAVIGESGLTIVESVRGTQILLREQDHIGAIIARGQEWEPHIREVIQRASESDGIAIDAGAYIGIHTLAMARAFGAVHAFEPQRRIYQILCGNLALNGCSNVTTYNFALYDRAGSASLAPPERQQIPLPLRDGQLDYNQITNAAALSFDFRDDKSGETIAVALDDFAFENVRLIKVDTQGADLHVLRGASETIQRCRPVVVFEWEYDLASQHSATLPQFFDFFEKLNYKVDMISNTTPDRQADYLATPR